MKKIHLTPKSDYESPNLHKRLDCFGEFNHNDPICFGGCALALCCANAKSNNFEGHFTEEMARPALTNNWNDLA
ncbi:MAG: hypothetical protein LBT38_07580 [Deltaproteobacteria bacterium]|jgi:hypothetical protein|nr:hypothetical protein [Deltaproteobacteria bacterium]